MAISHQKIPHGGWEFYEAKTNIRIVSSTWERLVQHVKNHRRINGLQEGDVENDIEAQILKHHPELAI